MVYMYLYFFRQVTSDPKHYFDYFEFPPANIILANIPKYFAKTKTIHNSMTVYRQPADPNEFSFLISHTDQHVANYFSFVSIAELSHNLTSLRNSLKTTYCLPFARGWAKTTLGLKFRTEQWTSRNSYLLCSLFDSDSNRITVQRQESPKVSHESQVL